MHKRIAGVLCVFTGLLFVLTIRTGYLQLWDGPGSGVALAAKALKLRTQTLAGEEFNRGEILDRNFISLTDSAVRPALVAFPASITDFAEAAKQLQPVMGLEATYTENMLQRGQGVFGLRTPVILKVNLTETEMVKFRQNSIPGLAILPLKTRYGPGALARHLIGHLNSINEGQWEKLSGERKTVEVNASLPTAYRITDRIGVAGLEGKFENALRGSTAETRIVGVADANGRLLQGLGYKTQQEAADPWRNHLILTLDRNYQAVVEKILDEHITRGAVAVIDITTGDVLAVASRPNYDQNMVSKYLAGRDELLDRTERVAFYPGSVFKAVVAAAALEEKLVSPAEVFLCRGSYIFNDGTEIKCLRPHGEVTLAEAIDVSCNTTFIQLGLRLGNDKLQQYAAKLGFTVNITSSSPPALLGNTSIGQQGVLVSPLQIANLYATLGRKGLYQPWRIMAEIRNYQGDVIQDYPRKVPERVLQEETSRILNEALIETAKNGSGQMAWLEEGGSAGKTGTAQANESNRVIAWYAGFAPANNPRLAIAVMVEENNVGAQTGLRGGATAAPLFKEIAKQILALELKN